MPRRRRLQTAGILFHVLNRGVKRAVLFDADQDYELVERLLRLAARRFQVRVFCYCLMPNHWHLVLSPDCDGELSRFMHWLTGVHAQLWHRRKNNIGTGAVYQGRFKAIPVQCDEHFLRVCRYVERNPVRAQLVGRAEEWRWSSLWRRQHRTASMLSTWPLPRPREWLTLVNTEPTEETVDLRRFINRSAPFGGERWARATAQKLNLQGTLRLGGRPRHALYSAESLGLTQFE